MLIVLTGALALVPAVAWGSGAEVIRDCTDNGAINDHHGDVDYQEALNNLPTDVDEYTDCRQIIATARRTDPGRGGGGDGSSGSGGGGGSSGGGSGGRSHASGASRRAKPKKVAPVPKGPPIVPPASRLGARPIEHGVPIPLIVTLALLGAAVIVALVAGGRRRGVHAPLPVNRLFHRVFPRRA